MKDPRPASAPEPVAFLEHYPEPGEAPHRIIVDQIPFRIGRSMTAHYIIYSRQVSKEHTEIGRQGAEFRIRDLASTNGTFVNGCRIHEAPLSNGDIIHIANKEFRFGQEWPGATAGSDSKHGFTEIASPRAPSSLIRGTEHLRELLRQHNVRIVYQPIVELATGKVFGYECLGRGTHSELNPSPAALFGIASQCNLAGELSRLFRSAALEEAGRLPEAATLFFNLHPSEMISEYLSRSLEELHTALRKHQRLVLEVHEALVTDPPTMRRLRSCLRELQIGLAYDDFGAGQARLTELVEVPPDYLKLDRKLIRGIEQAPARQELIRAFSWMCEDLGVKIIAEGIELLNEARTCLGLQCHYGQGFLFGKPQPLERIQLTGAASAWAALVEMAPDELLSNR